jgi:hypothetical protein
MAERLTDLLHRTVDDVPVPHPDAFAIATAGRARRTRRRVGAVAVAAAAVAVAGVGVAVVAGLDDGPARSSHVATHDSADDAYAELGAWAVGEHVVVGAATADLSPGAHHLAQTSVGVVTQQFGGSGGAPFNLVRPDGTVTPLSIPADAVTVDGDPNEPRVAWLVPLQDEGWITVWDVSTDKEIGTVRVDLPGSTPEGGRDVIQPVWLDGDFAYVGTDQRTTHRVEWATGADQELPYSPVSVRGGVAVSMDDDGTWQVVDAASGEVIRPLGRRLQTGLLSPDGRSVLVVRFDDEAALASIEPARGGPAVELPGINSLASWSRGGQVVGQPDDDPSSMRRCRVDGACTDTTIPWTYEEGPVVLPADYLMVG